MCDIAVPLVVQKYNKNMGGVDKSDQYLSYHNILRKTVQYWKTILPYGRHSGCQCIYTLQLHSVLERNQDNHRK